MGQLTNTEKMLNDVIKLQSPRSLMETFTGIEQNMALYESGIQEIRTKLEILQRDARFGDKHNPIESIKSRIKRPMSIIEKMYRKGFPISLQSIKDNLNDIAGIRVICPFIEDIYTVADMLIRQDDLTLIAQKDYIKNPKPNGYRSYHLIVGVPVYCMDGMEYFPVEVQLRTLSMDFWASMEHRISYKKEREDKEALTEELRSYANVLVEIERSFERHNEIGKLEK